MNKKIQNQIVHVALLAALILISAYTAPTSAAFAGSSSPVTAPGDASFNAADRLAIINLFGAYAQSYDTGNLKEFMSLFTDKVELKYMNRDEVFKDGMAQVTGFMTERVKAFQVAKIQRRHFLTTYAFASQTESEASGHLYVQLLTSKDGGLPSTVLTARYEFTAVKQGNTWKFSRWIARADQGLD